MLRNNVLSTIFQILLSIFWTLVLLLIGKNPSMEHFFYGNPLIPWILFLLILGLFFVFGKFLFKDLDKKEIFLSTLLPALIGYLTIGIALAGSGNEIFHNEVGKNLAHMPMYLYLMPQLYGMEMVGISRTPFTIGIAPLIGSGMMLLSLWISYWKANR